MKKLKFNWTGLFAILTIILCSIVLVHDFYKLLNGYCYTAFGLFTMFVVLFIMDYAVEYIQERVK